MVKKFYEDGDNSRILPGFNNNKCMKNNDGSKCAKTIPETLSYQS